MNFKLVMCVNILFSFYVFSTSLDDDLFKAVEKYNTEEIKAALNLGAKINALNEDGISSLHLAIKNANMGLVRFLVANGADVNIRSKVSALCFALKQKNREIPEFLMEKGARAQDPKDLLATLFQAVLGGFEGVVRLILEQEGKIDLNMKGVEGYSALFLASLQGHESLVKLLLEKGADPNIQRDNGDTPLHIVCSERHSQNAPYIAVFKLLIQKKASLNILNKKGQTPLDLAASNGNKELLSLIWDFGNKNLTEETEDGNKHLKLASSNNYLNIVKYLSEKGYKVSNKFIEQLPHHEIKKYLFFKANAIKVADLDGGEFHSQMSRKSLNLETNKEQKLAVEIKFKKLSGHADLYETSFCFKNGLANDCKIMFLKANRDLNDSEKIISFSFFENNKQKGWVEKSSCAYENDIIYKKNKKGSFIKNANILVFDKHFLANYNNDFSQLSFTLNSGKFSETLKLSRQVLPPPKEEKVPTVLNPDNKKVELPLIDVPDSKTRPTPEQFLGHFKGTSTPWNIDHAVVGEDNIVFYLSNHSMQTLEFERILPNKNISHLRKPRFAGGQSCWHFKDSFQVELGKSGDLILTNNDAYKNKKQAFVITLSATNDAEPENDRPLSGNILLPQTRPQELHTKPKIITPDEEIFSRRKQKKNARKNRKKLEKENSQKSLIHMDDIIEAKQADPENLRYLQEKLKDIPEIIIAKQKIKKPILNVVKYSLPQEKDREELLGDQKAAIRLDPSAANECPLLDGPWQGVAYNTMGEELPNKRLILSLNNIHGRRVNDHAASWGSLWASSLGQAGNYIGGKNVHWSYHKQKHDDKKYLYISHHYLFEIKESIIGDGYELILVKNTDKKVLNEVVRYKIYRLDIPKDSLPKYAQKHIGIEHDEIHQHEILNNYNKLYENILKELYNKNTFNVGIKSVLKFNENEILFNGVEVMSFDLYFVSQKCWEIALFTHAKTQTFSINIRTGTIANISRRKSKTYNES